MVSRHETSERYEFLIFPHRVCGYQLQGYLNIGSENGDERLARFAMEVFPIPRLGCLSATFNYNHTIYWVSLCGRKIDPLWLMASILVSATVASVAVDAVPRAVRPVREVERLVCDIYMELCSSYLSFYLCRHFDDVPSIPALIMTLSTQLIHCRCFLDQQNDRSGHARAKSSDAEKRWRYLQISWRYP